jgi:predicted permease
MLQDLRQALRSLAKRPSLALLTISVFALAIGANTTVFSVFNGFFLRPLPYPHDDRLVMVYVSLPKIGVEDAGTSIREYLDWRAQAPAFAQIAIFATTNRTLRREQPSERIAVTRTSPSLLAVLEVAPALGRGFTENEAVPGNERVILLSDRIWKTRFGGRADIVGQDVQLDDDSYRVVGVMPERFGFPDRNTEAWVPLEYTPAQAAEDQRFQGEEVMSIGRLRPDATVAGANAELDAIARRNVERLPQVAAFAKTIGYTVRARPLRDYVIGDLEQRLLVLQGLVLAVLLIACANVANLQLSRVIARRKELAVRAALGAGVGRLARLIVLETLLLGLAGAGGGLAFAYGGIQLVRALGLQRAKDGFEFSLDSFVLMVTVTGAVLAALLSALLPLLVVLREDVARAVQENGRANTGGMAARRWRIGLVVIQLAAGVALLFGAGLLTKTFYELQRRGPGFESGGIWSGAVALPSARYPDDAARARFFQRALAELRSLPGVMAAGFTSALPFSDHNLGGTVVVEGYQPAAGEPPPTAQLHSIDDGYFGALSIPVVKGRNFTPSETERVAIVDESFAATYWPAGNALGQRVRQGPDPPEWYTIVGVVPHVKHESLAQKDEFERTIYWPYSQQPTPAGMFVLRTSLPTESLTAAARAAIARLDAGVALYDVVPLSARVLRALGPQRASMVLTLVFAAVAVTLAIVGVYGLLAWAVACRVGEIGVRMALGARAADILRMIMKQGARMIVAGLVLGTAGAFALGRVLAARIPEIGSADPIVLVGAALALTCAALVASWLPARKAARVDPMRALRQD